MVDRLKNAMLEKLINKVEDHRNELPTPMYEKLKVGVLQKKTKLETLL